MYEDLVWPTDLPRTTVDCIQCGNWYVAQLQTVNNKHVTKDGCNRCGERHTLTPPPDYIPTQS